MVIVINCRFLTQPVTGVQRFGIEITKRLITIENSNIQYICVSPKGIIDYNLKKEFQVLEIGNLSGHLWEQIELPLFLKKHKKPLLVNLTNTAPLNYRNSIITIHDIAYTKNKDWFSRSFRKFYKFLIPKIIEKSKYVITVSEYSKSEISNFYNVPKEKISVLYNGVEHLSNTANNVVDKEDFFLVVGSLDPRKNLQRIISAFEELRLPLKIVGGKSKSFSEINIKANSNIEFLGRVCDDRLKELYAKSKAFIYLSLYEGFGIPPLEALMHNTVPIVSDIDVFHEVLGKNAIYCNPLSKKDIVAVVEKYNAKPFEIDISEGLISELENKYSWNSSAIILNRIIKQVYNL